jgi:ribosome-associated protein
MARKKKDNSEELLETIIEAIAEKKGQGIVSLHVGALPNAICEYFIICHADSTTQVEAIASNVEDMVIANCKEKPWQKGGYENGIWIILDFVNVVVHIFQTEWRHFYRLEDLWADAKRQDFSDDAPKKATPKKRVSKKKE